MTKFITIPPADGDTFTNAQFHDLEVGQRLTGVDGPTRIFQEVDGVDFNLPTLLGGTFIRASSFATSGGVVAVDLTGVATGDWLVIGATCDEFANNQGINGATLGVAGTTVAATLLDRGNAGQSFNTGFFKIQCPANAAGNSAAQIALSSNGGTVARCAAGVWRVTSEPALFARAWQFVSDVAPSTANVSMTTAADGSVFVIGTGTSASVPIATGFDIDGSATGLGRAHWYGSDGPTTAGSRTMTADSDARATAHAVNLVPAGA